MDSSSNTDIRVLSDGDVIDLDQDGEQLNIVAVTNPSSVGSVKMSLNGVHRTENMSPYSLCSEYNIGNYRNCEFSPGQELNIEATPYSEKYLRGTRFETKSLNVAVKERPLTQDFDMQLIEVSSGMIVRPLEASDIVDRSTFENGEWSIKVSPPASTSSVVIYRDGKKVLTSNESPLHCLWIIVREPTITASGLFLMENIRLKLLHIARNMGEEMCLEVYNQHLPFISSFRVDGVVHLYLFNTETGENIAALSEGAVIPHSMFTDNDWSIRATVNPSDNIKSVVFTLNDAKDVKDNSQPYTLCGDKYKKKKIEYEPCEHEPSRGQYTLEGTCIYLQEWKGKSV